MLGSMQTQSAKKFIDSALSLSDETQTEIFNMIQNPITKIQNNEKVTREDILKALKLVDSCNLIPADSENGHYFDDASEDVQTFTTSTPINIKKNSSHSNGINNCSSKKTPARPTSLKVSDDNALMPPPSFTPTKSRQKAVNSESERTSIPTASPLTPLKTLVESPHWNAKMRLHETEQRARAAELRVARAEAEREDAEALSVELREQLVQAERRAHTAETEVTRLRREALQWQDNKDELVEAKAELVLQAERIKTLEERLVESQARFKEANSARKDLERHLTDSEARISVLQQKLNEYKGRDAYQLEVETMRNRLKEAEARLAEELRCREALEQDVLSQQSVVQQMKIDQRIAEKRSSQQNDQQQNDNGDLAETSFDVSITNITSNQPALSVNGGENLGSIFHRELELARSKIQSLEAQLEEKQKTENRFVKESNELSVRNRFLEAQLSQFQVEYDNLKISVKNHADDVKTLKNTKFELEELKKSLSETKMDKESLLQRLKIVENERADLYGRLTSAMQELNNSSSEIQNRKETDDPPLVPDKKTADCVVEELRDYVAKLRSDRIDMEAAVVMALESQAAAETARDHLLEDLGTLQANLTSSNFDDLSSSLAALLTPEAVSLANALLHLPSKRTLEDEKTVVNADDSTQTEAEATTLTETKTEVSVQTGLQEVAIESPIMVEQANSQEESVQTHTVAVNEDEITQLREKLCLTEERYREERALSARAHHLCELNEKEARRFHAIGERYRSAITAFLSRLESRGLVELLRREGCGTDDAVSISYDIAQELNSVCSQLVLSGDRLSEMRKENIRLREDLYYLREKLKKSRNMEEKICYLTENSKYLQSELERMLQRQSLSSRDEQQTRMEHKRISLTAARPTIEDAADTDDDSVAYTDLSQISSRPPYSPPHSSDNRQHIEEYSPATSDRQQKRQTNGREQRDRGLHAATSSPPPPSHIQSVSSVREVSEPPPTCYSGPQNHSSKSTADEPERPEDMYARLAELRRRNDLQPFHLRTNYPVETQLQSPNQLFTLLQTVHRNGLEKQQQQRSHPSTESPAPAGFTLPPKGLQSISEVLLTGASGIVGAEKLDLTSTRARPTESVLKPTTKEVSLMKLADQPDNLREGDTITAPVRQSNPLPVKKEALAFEVELSPQRRQRGAPPPSLSQRSVARSDDTSKSAARSAIFRVSSSNPPSTASSKAPAKGWATPAAVAASNSRRPLKDATGKVNRSRLFVQSLQDIMGDIDPNVIKKTQDLLGKLIKKPTLTDKLLSRPPFRFIHDICSSLTRSTGIMKGLFTANESNSECIKDKDAKRAYLKKVIDFVTVANNCAPNVKISSIISGKDAECTNILLQLLADIANKGIDNTDCVNKALRVNEASSSMKSEVNEKKKNSCMFCKKKINFLAPQIFGSTRLPIKRSESETRKRSSSRNRFIDRTQEKTKGKKKTKLPITEYVDPEERFCYGITSENEKNTTKKYIYLSDMKSENPAPALSEPGIVGKTGHLIGALGSGLISGATGAVSLGASAVYTGVSVGTSVVSGALSYIPFPRFRSTAQSGTAPPTDLPKSTESDEDEDTAPLPPKSGGILSKMPLFRGHSKDKAD
ncbi:unnamed protein product [Hymenolepis diminuta]|uniref:TRAF3-interacting protein 1 n=2 Tax=Hymenolepis diminuta TaxID=6216 RepID=A0A158QCW7_HYMDI|nr:unnamed protein product [Hymenolepis diminuta]